MDKATKTSIIKEWGLHGKDVGSSEVQIAVLSARIKELTEHLKIHKKDNHTRRGLITMVNRRRKLLRYLDRTKHDVYLDICQKLGIRR